MYGFVRDRSLLRASSIRSVSVAVHVAREVVAIIRHALRGSTALMTAAVLALPIPSVGAIDGTNDSGPTYELKVRLVGDDLEFGAFDRIAACRVECIGDSATDDVEGPRIGVSPGGEPLAQGDGWVGTTASTTSGTMRGPVPPGEWRIAIDVNIDGQRYLGYVTGHSPQYISTSFSDGLVIPVINAPVAHEDVPITDVAPQEPTPPEMPGRIALRDDYVLNDKFYFSEWKGSGLPAGARVVATLRLCDGKVVVRRTVGRDGRVGFPVEGLVPKMPRRSSISVVARHPDYSDKVTDYDFLFEGRRYRPGC